MGNYTIELPALGAHLNLRSRLYKTNEWHAVPLPKAETTEEVLRLAEAVKQRGYFIIAPQQRFVTIRLPREGEKADIVGETCDDLPKATYMFHLRNAATGTMYGKLWFGSLEYPILGSMEFLKQMWARKRIEIQRNRVLLAGGS